MRKEMIDLKTLGERLRQIRTLLGITQKQLARANRLSQSAVSRLENGEEVYASVLASVLNYYQGKVSLDNLFAQEFSAEADRALYSREAEKQNILTRQLDIVEDTIRSLSEISLEQIAKMKMTMSD